MCTFGGGPKVIDAVVASYDGDSADGASWAYYMFGYILGYTLSAYEFSGASTIGDLTPNTCVKTIRFAVVPRILVW